jgi:hypothetical protein
MDTIQVDAPRRARSTRAEIGHAFRFQCAASILSFISFWRDPRQAYPRLTDRLARDVGLDPADLEWVRLELPSQTTRHPML